MSDFTAGVLVTVATAVCIGIQWRLYEYASRKDADHWLNRPIFSKKRRP